MFWGPWASIKRAEPLALLEAKHTLELLHLKFKETLVEILWQRASVTSWKTYPGDEYNICDAWYARYFLLTVLL